MYFKKFAAFAAIAVAALLSTVNNASATYYTTNATIEVYNPTVGPPPVDDVYQGTFQTSGKAYTNQWSGAGPNAPGSEIRTVTIQTVTGVLVPGNDLTPSYIDTTPGPGETAAQFIVISAVRGTVLPAGPAGNHAAVFTEGTAFATYRAGATGATAIDPTTFSFANTFSQYELVNDDVDNGFPFDAEKALPFTVSANAGGASVPGQINTSSPNTVLAGQLAYFLFKEASTREQNAAAGPDGSGNFGDDFISNAEFPALPGLLPGAEGIVSELSQTIDPAAGYASLVAGGTYAADLLTALNAIWAAAFPGEVWASGITLAGGGAGPDHDWDPFHASGDFRGNLSGRFGPTIQAVPEPSTLALFGLGIAGLVGYRARRRSK